MAELEDAPWVKTDELEDAPWAKKKPGYVEDVLKTIPSAAAKGVIAVAGTPGDIGAAAKVVDQAGYNPFGWLADKIGATDAGKWLKDQSAKTAAASPALANSGDMMGGGNIDLPTSGDIQKNVESVTGKFHEPQTSPGKVVGTTLEVAPSLAMGPIGGVKGLAVKSIGAGVGGEAARSGAEAIKDKLPTSVQPWAEPVAQAVGTLTGMFTPAGARRVVTPLPMSDERKLLVDSLKKSDPEFMKTATTGQLTESPRLMGVEARTLPEQEATQRKAFTKATLDRGEDTGKRIGQIYDTGQINSTEFPALNTAISKEKRTLAGITGTEKAQDVLGDIQKEIKLGAANSPNTLNMTGKRYQYMRDRLQGMIDDQKNGTIKDTLVNVKTHLDDAFKRSIPNPDELDALRHQKRQFEVLAQRKPTLDQTMKPEDVLNVASKMDGRRQVNIGASPLANWARDANQVMTPLPAVSGKVPPWFDLGVTGLGSLLGGGAGHGVAAGAEGGVLTHLLGPSLYNAGAKAVSKVATSEPVQQLLGNQLWRPGAASTAPTKAQLVRLLMSPEFKGQ